MADTFNYESDIWATHSLISSCKRENMKNITIEPFIENELYTDSINDVLVKCADFMIRHPKNSLNPKIERARLLLASAHRLSRIFTDREHRDMWDRQIKETKDLLKKAEVENVLAGVHK